MSRTVAYRGIALVAGFVLALLMIATTSRAVWVDTTSNPGNTVASGSVVLTDDAGGTALFTITDAKPGQTWSRCIDVIYQGTVGADVLMTNLTVTGDAALADELDATIGISAAADCTGAAALGTRNFGAFDTVGGGAPALGDTWAVTAAGQHRSYQIAVTFDATADNASQNKGVAFAFTWTATSN
jgi:hypothetical protein